MPGILGMFYKKHGIYPKFLGIVPRSVKCTYCLLVVAEGYFATLVVVVGGWLVVGGGWWLVVGGWWLEVGGWWGVVCGG